MGFLNGNIKITRVLNAVAAGVTNQNGTVLDMAGYEGVVFIAAVGALTATQVTSLKAQQGAASDGSDATDLANTNVGPLADADGNKCLVLDVNKPSKRYVRCVLVRGTANAVVDGVWAIQYGPTTRAVTHDTTVVSSESHQTPAEGTA